MSEELMHSLEFTDAELTALNKVVREHKVNISLEEIALVQMGQTQSPFLTALFKIAGEWEKTQEAAKKASAEPSKKAEVLEPEIVPLVTAESAN